MVRITVDQHISLHRAAEVGSADGITHIERLEVGEAFDEIQCRVAVGQHLGALPSARHRVATLGEAVGLFFAWLSHANEQSFERIIIVTSIVSVAFTFGWVSRRFEWQADAFAVQQTSGQDLGRALLKLYEDNAATLTPDPVYVKFYYSHPPASERLAAMRIQAA